MRRPLGVGEIDLRRLGRVRAGDERVGRGLVHLGAVPPAGLGDPARRARLVEVDPVELLLERRVEIAGEIDAARALVDADDLVDRPVAMGELGPAAACAKR